MDERERAVFLRMFAVQGLLIQALVDALRSKEILTAADEAAFIYARLYEELSDAAPTFRHYIDLYNLLSEGLGLGLKVQIT